MALHLLPRLSRIGVDTALEGESLAPQPSTTAALETYSSFISFAASGGQRSESVPEKICEAIRKAASICGFQSDTEKPSFARFDRLVSELFGKTPYLRTGEFLRDDIWSFMTTALAPDIVAWRFPNKTGERFYGGARNAFQRLWIRGVTLDRGENHPDRWGLVRQLTEDAMVQIFERPTISADQKIARSLAEGWIRCRSKMTDSGNMENAMRKAAKMLRIRLQIQDIGTLPQDHVDLIIDEMFALARGDSP